MESKRAARIACLFGGMVASLLAMTNLSGCASTGAGGVSEQQQAAAVDPTRIEERDDIYEVVNFWANEPWLREGGRVVGFRVSTRFVASESNKGAFVPGRIFIWLYGYEPNFDGVVQRKLLHVWEMDRNEAMGWRITRRTRTGLAYWFLMRWPDELNLQGRRIDVEVGYERVRDKRLIMSGTKLLEVPSSAPAPAPAPRAVPSTQTTRIRLN